MIESFCVETPKQTRLKQEHKLRYTFVVTILKSLNNLLALMNRSSLNIGNVWMSVIDPETVLSSSSVKKDLAKF